MTKQNLSNNPVAMAQMSVLPEFWPTSDIPEPVRAVWIPWPIAVLLAPLFWLMPKRVGPHFAAASWWAAIVAHLTWSIYGIGSLLMVFMTDGSYSLLSWLAGRTPEQLGYTLLPTPTLGEILRAPLGMLATQAANLSSTSPLGFSQVDQLVRAIMYWGLMELGMIVLAAILMPYITVGERTRNLFARAIRLVLWSSTSLVVLAMVLQALMLAGLMSASAIPLAVALYVAWAVSMVIRGGTRYAGPAWEPHKPLCETCGYWLTGLPVEAMCPECGTAVADSLPDRRKPSRFAAARGLGPRLWAFLVTGRAVCRDREFFTTLRTRGEYQAARRFALWICVLSGIMLIELLAIINTYCIPDLAANPAPTRGDRLAVFAFWSIVLSFVLVLLIGLVTLLVSGFGRRLVRRYAVAVFYWSAWLLPTMTPLVVTVLSIFRLKDPAHSVGTAATLAIAAGVVCLSIGVKAFGVLVRAVRGVRFANS